MDKRVSDRAYLDEWVGPDIVDEKGYLRPGKILEWMDVVGVVAATRYIRAPVVTAAVDGLYLKAPICLGSRITMCARVSFTSARSMGLTVTMTHQPNHPGSQPAEVTEGYMSFVALDEEGRAKPVPQLVPNSKEEEKQFQEGRLRHEFRKQMHQGSVPPPTPFAARQPTLSRTDEALMKMRELLKGFPLTSRLPWTWDTSKPKQRSHHHSYIHKVEPVFTGQTNFHGTLYGGILMRWVETAASLSAEAYLDGAHTRMIGLHGLNFINPAKPNCFVHIRTRVVHNDDNSLTALVDAESEDPLAGSFANILRGFITYQPTGRHAEIPQLQTNSETEQNLFCEVQERLELHRNVYQEAELL